MPLLKPNIPNLLRNRHWLIIKKHLTLKKLANVLRNSLYYRMNCAHVSSFPLYAKIETTDICNLRCKNCHDGTVPRKNIFLDFSIYTNLIDQLVDYLCEISLFDQGEPLIDHRIHEFIEYASKRNIGTVISTNLSMELSDEKLIRLVKSGLDYMQIGIDGTTQDRYGKYRIGGELELVLSNLRRIIAAKKKLNSKTPVIEWQMIDYGTNQSDQKEAQMMARDFGVEVFATKPDCYSTFPSSDHVRQNRCRLLWSSLTVECDGMVSACLTMDDDSLYVGDLNHSSITEIWNSEKFIEVRKSHIRNAPNNKYFCKRCNRFDRNANPLG